MAAPIGSMNWAACEDCKLYDPDQGCCANEVDWQALLVASLASDEVRCGCWEKAA